ncbi:hypothetical protein M7775_18165 [Sporomusa sphaeroides DSM 2875]|uniref:hypothetical protein n=1 Tax=Sporomusa sphaeroides TaxID=47679 RepID=UPI00202FC4F5|nr:hypothetical protein [Sporomusa sphaeroides]MCM0760482.1 hypothetical protein [Sporomusa sphaeroides DSM 2875]
MKTTDPVSKDMETMNLEEFCKLLHEHGESPLILAAAERLKTAENHITEIIERHLNQCLTCEKLDFAAQIVELNGSIENLRHLINTDRQARLKTMNRWLGKYNIPHDSNWRNAIDKLIAGGEAKP